MQHYQRDLYNNKVKGIAIIPTYNERENIPVLVERIWKCVPQLHILVVDDNSPDRTGDLVRALAEQHPGRISLLARKQKQGLGRAYVHAFQHVLSLDYDFLIHMDADLSHDPVHIPSMIEKIADADLVLGSRYVNGISVVGWDFKRLILSKFATWYVAKVTGLQLSDATGGFRCWRTSALRQLGLNELSSMGYLILVEMAYWAYRKNFRIAEVPIIFHERRFGASKISMNVIRESALGVLSMRWRYRYRDTSKSELIGTTVAQEK